MKKVICMFISVCMIFSLRVSTFAASVDSETITPTGEYEIVIVEVNGTELEVPAIRNVESTSRSADGVVTSTQTIFVPDGTDDSLSRNAQIVSEIKTYGSPRTRGYGDFYVNGYIWFHSTLNYTTTTRNGAVYFDLISFKLEREIYTESVFNNFNQASAHVMQIGADYYENRVSFGQEQYYSAISYNTLYTVPSSWIPVYNVGYFIGVEYSVFIDYNNDLGLQDYTLTHIHQAV